MRGWRSAVQRGLRGVPPAPAGVEGALRRRTEAWSGPGEEGGRQLWGGGAREEWDRALLCPTGSGGGAGEFLGGALWETREGGIVGGGKDLGRSWRLQGTRRPYRGRQGYAVAEGWVSKRTGCLTE